MRDEILGYALYEIETCGFDEIKSTHPPLRRISSTTVDFTAKRFSPPE